jgi:adenylate cyclase
MIRPAGTSEAGSRTGSPLLSRAWEREARLTAGLILFAFVATHLINHALGIFGVATMEVVQHWRTMVWRSWPGTILLYGAAVVHVGLGLKRIVWRRSWRMPVPEAAQIVLGLAIPWLLVDHAMGTRYASSFLGTDDSYPIVLMKIWSAHVFWQTVLVLVVWSHAVIGLYYAFRPRAWFQSVRGAGLVAAFLVPLLALAGFVAGGRESVQLNPPGVVWTAQQTAGLAEALQIAHYAILAIAAVVAASWITFEVRRLFSHRIPINYVGHGKIYMRPGSTLLEASRDNGIPHPSLCGGRGRCSTCRVLVLTGEASLAEPNAAERRLLESIGAPSRVRLACQIKPTSELSVQILLQTAAGWGHIDWEEETYKWGAERDVTIVIVDIRGFTALASNQLPQDTVVFVNRFLAEMRQAVEAHGGRIGMFLSDGLMAVFGLGERRHGGSRAAVRAAMDMLKAVRTLNTEFGPALPVPLRIGVGVHRGRAVIARVGDPDHGYVVTALGETVSIASRLEAATKELLADCLVSEETLAASRLRLPGAMTREVRMRGREKPIKVYAVNETVPEDAAPAEVPA